MYVPINEVELLEEGDKVTIDGLKIHEVSEVPATKENALGGEEEGIRVVPLDPMDEADAEPSFVQRKSVRFRWRVEV